MTCLLIPADPLAPATLVETSGDYLQAVAAYVPGPVDVTDLLDANGDPSGMSLWFTEDGASRGLPANAEASRLVRPLRIHGPVLVTRGEPDEPDELALLREQVAVLRDLLDLSIAGGA